MKTIVVLVRNYKPYNSAVGVCMSNITEVLRKDNKIIVICEKSKIDESDIEQIDGETIVRFVSKQTLTRSKIKERINKSNGIRKTLFRALGQFLRILFFLRFILQKISIRKDLINSFSAALESIEQKVDIIIPTCMPIESIIAAQKYCNKHDTVYIPVLYDKFAANRTLQRFRLNEKLKMNANIRLEEKLFEDEKCERILYTKSWKNHMEKYHKDINNLKSNMIEHPLLRRIESKVSYRFVNNEKIKIVFGGTLTYKGRDPEYSLLVISKVIQCGDDIGLYVFGGGDAMETVRQYEKSLPQNVHYMGRVATDLVHAYMGAADCLLSIGNEDISQTASKVFEYMSYCKPIIHFARYKDDPVIGILKLYPNAFATYIGEYSVEETAKMVSVFLEENGHLNVSFDDLLQDFYNATPGYSADIILGGG